MSRMSDNEISVRTAIVSELYDAIELADSQGTSAEFIAGMETALAIISRSADARPEELRNA